MAGPIMHRYGALSFDIGWAALSPFMALLIRENFVIFSPHWDAITTYAAISVIASIIIFLSTGQHKALWQYTSLPDVLRIIGVVRGTSFFVWKASFIPN